MLCCTRSFLSLSKQLKCILVDIDKAHKTTGHSSIFHPTRLMFRLFNISYRSLLAWICCLIVASKGIINCRVHLFDHTCPSSVFVYSFGSWGKVRRAHLNHYHFFRLHRCPLILNYHQMSSKGSGKTLKWRAWNEESIKQLFFFFCIKIHPMYHREPL
jgi:hypothetical protein